MANEAVLIHEIGLGIPMTVQNQLGLEKGTLLTLIDPLTVSGNSALNQAAAGIAVEEKIASDGRTKISVYRDGIFRVKASGSITVGRAVSLATSANYVYEPAALGAGTPGGRYPQNYIGIALETAAADDTFLMELRPQTINVSGA